MVRLRRIENRDRFFFVTANLARGVPHLSPAERDLFIHVLASQRSPRTFQLFAYVVMPDHFHLLLVPQDRTLIQVMRDLKSKTGFAIAQRRHTPGRIWQPRYFDNIIRRVRDFWEKVDYIHQNPVAAGLVERPED